MSALLEKLLEGVAGEIRPDEPLAPRTSIKVGGRAEVLVRPASLDALVALLKLVRGEGVPLTVLGGGANTLVGDGGVPGVTLRLPVELFPEELEPKPDGGRITLWAGAPIVRVIHLMKAHQLVGAEFLAGIPGTIGGACAMNAGTRAGECMGIVEAVELATAEGVGWVSRRELACGYRRTALPEGAVVTRARFELPFGDVVGSQARMAADYEHRKRTQPLKQPSFGSVFTNPPGDHAGRLVESVGLKGHVVGGAQISSLHANWIVNLGGATAKDVVTLMELAKARVREATGVVLEPEVRRVGHFH